MEDLGGIAAVITAIGVLVAALGSTYINIKSTKTIKATHGMVKEIDTAVNGRKPGQTTMVSQVQDLHDDRLPVEHDAILPMLRRLIIEMEAMKKNGTP